MKQIAIILLSLTAALGFAQSQISNSGIKGQDILTGYQRVPASITQSNDTSTITPANSVACAQMMGAITVDNSYLRRFDLDGEFGITGVFDISSVDFGLEALSAPTAPAVVNLYTIPDGAAFTFANLTLIGTSNITLTMAQGGTVVNAPVVGSVADPVATDLVVEVFTPSLLGVSASVFIGSNANGETAPSFLASSDCMIDDPIATSGIGNPQMQIVMIVNGDVQDCTVSSIIADNSAVIINGDCSSGLDVWCQTPDAGDVLLATGVVVDGSTSVALPAFTPDAIYYTTRPGETGIANAIDGVVSNRTVPTLGEWGLLAFITLLMGAALVVMKKQRTA